MPLTDFQVLRTHRFLRIRQASCDCSPSCHIIDGAVLVRQVGNPSFTVRSLQLLPFAAGVHLLLQSGGHQKVSAARGASLHFASMTASFANCETMPLKLKTSEKPLSVIPINNVRFELHLPGIRQFRTMLQPPCLRQRTWTQSHILIHGAFLPTRYAQPVWHLSYHRDGRSIWRRRSRCRALGRCQVDRGNRAPGKRRPHSVPKVRYHRC